MATKIWAIRPGDDEPTSFAATGVGLQQAFDFPGGTGGCKVWGTPGQIVGVTNHSMYANTMFDGSGMNTTELWRDPAATGITIREKTAAEGNGTQGATGIWLRNFKIMANGSAGDGINLGNQGGAQLNINAGLENVFVNGFASGTGMKLNGNASYGIQIWSNNNQVGIEFSGGGTNKWYSVRAEGNTANNILLKDSNNSLFGVQCEENANAGASGTIEVSGSDNFIYSPAIGLFFNRQNLIVLKSGGHRLTVINATAIANGHAYSNLIYDEALSKGSGPTHDHVPLWLDNGSYSSYIFNSDNGDLTELAGALFPYQPTGVGNNPSAASTITINPGLIFPLNGNGTVDTINFAGGTSIIGKMIVLQCQGNAVVKDGTGNLKLNGDFMGSPDATLTLVGDYTGNFWVEVSRSTLV